MKRELDARETNLHAARVYLMEAARRRHTRSFHATLLTWAANARRRAAAVKTAPLQFQLFQEDAT